VVRKVRATRTHVAKYHYFHMYARFRDNLAHMFYERLGAFSSTVARLGPICSELDMFSIRLCGDEGGNYWYFIGDDVYIPRGLIADMRILSERFPDVFSWYTVAFRTPSHCFGGSAAHVPAMYDNCCSLNVHHGLVSVLRIRIPSVSVKRKRYDHLDTTNAWWSRYMDGEKMPEVDLAVERLRWMHENPTSGINQSLLIGEWVQKMGPKIRIMFVEHSQRQLFCAHSSDTLQDVVNRYKGTRLDHKAGEFMFYWVEDYHHMKTEGIVFASPLCENTCNQTLAELSDRGCAPEYFEIYTI